VAVWYPAVAGDTVVPMRQSGYLDLPGVPAPASFRERYIAFCQEVIAEETGGTDARAAFQEARTAACPDTVPAAGSFPLVLNHPGLGAAYADNSVLHEYLASHGYIVVGSAYESEDAGQVNLDWDLDRSTKDLEFLINVAAETLPNADREHIGAVGHSFGGQAVVVYHSGVNNPLRAAVSLDATMEYGPRDSPGLAPLRARIVGGARATAPLLVFNSTWDTACYDIYEPVTRADRYFCTLAHVKHNDYLIHGAFGAERRGDTAIRAAYDALCRCVLGFLDGTLKGEGTCLAELQARAGEPENGADPVRVISCRAATPAE
jgi:hypothetical protein